MQIRFYRGLWGMEGPSLEANLRQIQQAGFDGVEMAAPADPAERRALGEMLKDLGLELIAQMYTRGNSPEEHARSFEEQYCRTVELRPRLINSHTGKDYYTLEENGRILRLAEQLEGQYGVPIVHEVHRGRATFSAPATAALIQAFPNLRLAADLSHWCCVHESMLQDQPERVELTLQHTHHIHARVGHPEGPQVNDPRAPEWRDAVETHLGWWQRVADLHAARGSDVLTVTPEFGPPGYMPTLPFTRVPVTNLWDVNVYMRDLLRERLSVA